MNIRKAALLISFSIFLSACTATPPHTHTTYPPELADLTGAELAAGGLAVYGAESPVGESPAEVAHFDTLLYRLMSDYYPTLGVKRVVTGVQSMDDTVYDRIFDPVAAPWNDPVEFAVLESTQYARYMAYYNIIDDYTEKDSYDTDDKTCFVTRRSIVVEFFVIDTIGQRVAWKDKATMRDKDRNCNMQLLNDTDSSGVGFGEFIAGVLIGAVIDTAINVAAGTHPEPPPLYWMAGKALVKMIRKLPDTPSMNQPVLTSL